MLKSMQRSAVRNPVYRSTDRDDFRTPLGVLSLIKGGVVRELIFLTTDSMLQVLSSYRFMGLILPDTPSPQDVTLH
jgi:hypothetical protein